jgi:hypothetical protein
VSVPVMLRLSRPRSGALPALAAWIASAGK